MTYLTSMHPIYIIIARANPSRRQSKRKRIELQEYNMFTAKTLLTIIMVMRSKTASASETPELIIRLQVAMVTALPTSDQVTNLCAACAGD